MELANIIRPERVGLWTVAAFIIALCALVASVVSIIQYKEAITMTQMQVLVLNKKIQDLTPPSASAAPAPAEQMVVPLKKK